ncbi:TIGR02611 family protein [Rhodococcus hoagii]|uniref:TIGR02611 family protein n=3 Tax=Rhodococcus hoagii TaxID=43767 RepID=E9SVV7_RHOHA|nr:TIGR02611 family protein [Prescottella equi]EGD26172.1 TIGR02611 family protein [Prescottella equi ATCC 33707]MBM4484447.1 TIGR02611 family protein [Prescottella equi]MBM4488263.1 TIGR02611 family protein [Prescottella equi]MBM4496661.1 TIGR02611 family protein [Prescottella equi]MBM4499444.1 TIGR02611 family protein [Prescottella equi]
MRIMDGQAVSKPADGGGSVESSERDGFHPIERVENRWLRWRRRIARNTSLNLAYRIGVGVVGALVLAVGIVTIPYPGPGWLIVFAGLGILASEFAWAYRLLHWARARYDRFMIWFSEQSAFVKFLGLLFTTAVVLATLWILGTFGLVGGWVGLEQPWLESPL